LFFLGVALAARRDNILVGLLVVFATDHLVFIGLQTFLRQLSRRLQFLFDNLSLLIIRFLHHFFNNLYWFLLLLL